MERDLTAFAFETLAVQSGNLATSLTNLVYSPASGGLPARAATIVITNIIKNWISSFVVIESNKFITPLQ